MDGPNLAQFLTGVQSFHVVIHNGPAQKSPAAHLTNIFRAGTVTVGHLVMLAT